MDQRGNEHSHRHTDNDSAVLSGAAAVQETARDKRPHLTLHGRVLRPNRIIRRDSQFIHFVYFFFFYFQFFFSFLFICRRESRRASYRLGFTRKRSVESRNITYREQT